MITGLRGEDEADARGRQAEQLATATRNTIGLAVTHLANGVTAAGRGRPDQAFDHLWHLFAPNDAAAQRMQACRTLGHLEPLLAVVEVVEHRPLGRGRRRGARVHVLIERQFDQLLARVANKAQRVVALLHALDLLAEQRPVQNDAAVRCPQMLLGAIQDGALRLPGHAVLRPDRL